MDKTNLVNIITKQVMSKLEDSNLNTQSCSTEQSIRNSWDGVGTVGDLLSEGIDRLGICSASLGSCPDQAIARMIDHTILKADATKSDIEKHCKVAAEYKFKSVCVNPVWVAESKKFLRGSGVKVCTVIGFPLGAQHHRAKAMETRIAIDDGANEVDTVINVGALKSGDYKLVLEDLRSVTRACRPGVISKVILETCYLTDEEIVKACELAGQAGYDFVKTSTGFGTGGATAKHVALMRKTVGDKMGVKASGGIRDHEGAMNMLGAGASRLGVSASIAIVECKDSRASKGY